MVILGLDIATRKTGWCCGDGASIPECDVLQFEQYGADLGGLGGDLHDRLVMLTERFKPELVCYESPIVLHGKDGGRADNLPFLRQRFGMDFYIETFFTRRGVLVKEVDLHAIKREVTGNAMADKDAMVAVARRCGLKLPTPGADDAADAWGAWLCALRAVDKPASAKWDSRIWSRRGAML